MVSEIHVTHKGQAEYRIVAAPMAGGPSTPELVAALHRAGQLGFLASGSVSAASLRADCEKAAELCGSRDFGVNLFAPQDPLTPQQIDAARAFINDHPEEFGEAELSESDYSFGWDEKFEVVLELRPRVISSTFGCCSAEEIERAHDRGIEVWATVTTPQEARTASERGVDALVVQGAAAGGHRGSWRIDDDPADVPLETLIARISACTDLPLIAAGGITAPEAVRDALALPGVSAVSCGTAYLLAAEAGTSAANREILRSGLAGHGSLETHANRGFSGRIARGVATAFTEEYGDSVPPMYPLLAPLLKERRRIARYAYCLAGTGVTQIKEASAEEITRQLLGC